MSSKHATVIAPPHATRPSRPSAARRIACISTSRADAGIYRPLLSALACDAAFEPVCLAGGTHFSTEFGRSIDDVCAEGVRVVKVEHFVPGDDPVCVARTAGGAVGGFAAVLVREQPDLVFVLGDRTEMLAAALAATICGVPIAHLHGGDATYGAYDDACRHSISKLAHIHFPAAEEHGDRLRAMGEDEGRIHVVGALALDALREFRPESVAELSAAVGMDFAEPTIVVAFHPETLGDIAPAEQIAAVLAAVESLDANILLIGSNADVGHAAIGDALKRFAATRPRTALIAHLQQDRFWNCLAHARLLVGNSSAGVIEAASLGLPVVNVGDRQKGRIRGRNVVDAGYALPELTRAIARAMDAGFRAGLRGATNPYGDGRAAERILAVLRKGLAERKELLRKDTSIGGAAVPG